MSKARLACLFLAGTGLAGAAVLIVPGARHGLEHLVRSQFPHLDRTSTAARAPVTGPREAAAGQEGPGKITTRVTDDTAPTTPPGSDTVAASAAEMSAKPATEVDPPRGPTVAQTDPDADRVRQALVLYRKGDVAGGDIIARTATGPIARLTLEWAALRLQPQQLGLQREDAFATAHPDWSAMPWLKRRIEEAVAAQKADVTGAIDSRLSAAPLETVSGKLALARLKRTRGLIAEARDIVEQVWRNEDLTPWQETYIQHDFGDLVDKADHKFRADRLLYDEQSAAALREATLAGPDVVLLAKARAAVIANAPSDAAMAAVPKPLQSDPGLLFARIQKARRANRIEEAANLMLGAPRDPQVLIDGDQWWVERRLIARKLLDQGDAKRAYRIAAEHSASTTAMKIEAEFHAGWIALRFLDDPKLSVKHFDAMAAIAETPISRARAAYWQGRAAEASGNAQLAAQCYAKAARYPITFYGQLAAAKSGQSTIALRDEVAPAAGDARSEAVRVAEYLYGVGARDLALPLALDVARYEPSDAQVAAMGAVVEQARDAWATLAVGKAATQRGMPLDETAFPTFGIPEYQPLRKSADLAIVYAIARQESEFDQHSSSSAGAKGLMQMISSTARRTAEHAGVDYNDARLVSDAAFNAQLGAAHLGELLDEQGGSLILTFAAYNAGGKNVKDWIEAYGDPRKPGVDPVDWIERIPFTETRNYVQRVMENLRIYRVRLGQPSTLAVGADLLTAGGKGT